MKTKKKISFFHIDEKLKKLPFKDNYFDLWNTVLPSYINSGLVTGQTSSDLWLDVGTPERLKLANTVYNEQINL